MRVGEVALLIEDVKAVYHTPEMRPPKSVTFFSRYRIDSLSVGKNLLLL